MRCLSLFIAFIYIIKYVRSYSVEEWFNSDQAVLITINQCYIAIHNNNKDSPCEITHFSKYF